MNIQIAGVGTTIEKVDGKKEISESSKNLFIETIPTSSEILINEEFQERQATRLYDYLVNNLPHGVFRKFVDRIVKEEIRMSELKRLRHET